MVFKHNLGKNELVGLILLFIGASWLGYGIYATLLAANNTISQVALVKGNAMLIFPLFYGVGALLVALGRAEMMGALHRR